VWSTDLNSGSSTIVFDLDPRQRFSAHIFSRRLGLLSAVALDKLIRNSKRQTPPLTSCPANWPAPLYQIKAVGACWRTWWLRTNKNICYTSNSDCHRAGRGFTLCHNFFPHTIYTELLE